MSDGKPTPSDLRTPLLHEIPAGLQPRLIEAGFNPDDASAAGRAERYRRGETPQTIHVWWARRPHRVMRAIVFASLVDGSSKSGDACLRELTSATSPSTELVETARRIIADQGSARPRLLDMFGGGGTIPYEAALLGADATSLECNQLSVFLQRANLAEALACGDRLPELIEAAGRRVLEALKRRTAEFFPLRESGHFGYYWTYSISCAACDGRLLLAKRPWLSKKSERFIGIDWSHVNGGFRVKLGDLPEGFAAESCWKGRKGEVQCPHCEAILPRVTLAATSDELIAVASLSVRGVGKRFGSPPSIAAAPNAGLAERERRLLATLGGTLPSSRLPKWSGIVNPAIYGMETHAEIFNRRQRVVMLELIALLREEHDSLLETESPEVALAVTAALSGFIDQLVDWDCRLSVWIPQNEQVGRAFCGPGVAMIWDYMETDPLQRGPANLWKKLDRIIAGSRALMRLDRPVRVVRGYAQDLPFPDGSFDAIVTDPPYYDNVFYQVLADFFFVWKRMLFADIDPDLFADATTDAGRELVASRHRSGSKERAHEDYCRELSLALSEAERVLKKTGVLSLVYGHSSRLGWAALLRAMRSTGLMITCVLPLGIERRQRPRAMSSDAINTCIVLVARKGRAPREAIDGPQFDLEMRPFTEDLAKACEGQKWSEADIGLTLYAQGIGILANAKGDAARDESMLARLEAIVLARCPGFRISGRGSI